MSKEKLNHILNVENEIVVPEVKNNQEIIIDTKKEEKKAIDEDFEKVRENLKNLIKTSKEVLDSMYDVAKETDSARAYEVVSDLLKTNFEANSKLLDLHKQVKAIKEDKSVIKTSGDKVTNNAIFVGNTTDLLKMIKDKKNKELLPDVKTITDTVMEDKKNEQ